MALGTGLPIGTLVALVAMGLFPVAAYLLYRVDRERGDGRVTVLGRG